MSQAAEEYYWVITDAGAALEAGAHAKGLPVKLTHMAVGDGDGSVPTPNRHAASLVNEVLRRPIDARRQDEEDKNIAWISMVIPATVGGFWIREVAIYAQSLEEDGEPVLYAVGNHAPYYKAEKILGQAVSHEIEAPIIMSGEANLQIEVRDSGYASQSSMNGVLAELARQKGVDEGHDERITALEEFDAAHDVLATVENSGHVKPDGSTISIKPDGTVSVAQGSHWLLGEFYFFRHPEPRPGFEVLDGGVIENGADMYPEFWQYIQTSEGQLLCKTAAEREELANHIYYTLADGFVITYGGIGGVPFFTIDTATGKIVMPDIRGMHLEAAGFDSLNVGGVAIDATRLIFGWLGNLASNLANAAPEAGGALYWAFDGSERYSTFESCAVSGANPEFNSGRYVPVGPVNRPRSFGVLACAYMGIPASLAAS